MRYKFSRPTTEDSYSWQKYWQELGQEWRTEPEISADREVYLSQLLEIKPDKEQHIYPFQNIEWHRRDVEWLLMSRKEAAKSSFDGDNEDPFQPWTDYPFDNLDLLDEPFEQFTYHEYQYEYTRLNICGANLIGADLQGLPLEEADLSEVILEGANLYDAKLKRANLSKANLRNAKLTFADLEEADLTGAHLGAVRK
jgi:hypothetical protein